MELKVWVDGIQRVVCGANYNTTCQDVVLALAHAMGRTGRFTLVEKWRDTERPLTPGECPLQSLHKWGEYAAEVRFYLVQAETEKTKQAERGNPKKKSSGEKMDTFSHNFTPPKSPHHLYPQGPETIKRSSTFSGAHNMNYTNPNSLPASMSSSHHGRNQQYPSGPPPTSSSNSKFRRTTLGPMPNGENVGMSSASSSSSSPRISPRGQSSAHMSRAPSSAPRENYSGDARELHPANMPGASSSSYYSQGVDHSSQRQPPSQYPYTAAPHQTYSSSQQPHSKSANSQMSYMPSAKQTHPSSSQASFPASSQPPQSTQQRYASSQQDKTSSSRQPYSENTHTRSSGHPVPAPRHHINSPDLVEYENIPFQPRDQRMISPKRERSRERSQRNIPSPGQSLHLDAQNYSRERSPNELNQNRTDFYGHPNQQGAGDDFSHFNRLEMSDTTEREYFAQFQDNSERASQDYPSSFNYEKNAQGRPRTSDANKFSSGYIPGSKKSSNSEASRPIPQPQISKGLPTSSRSISDGLPPNGVDSRGKTTDNQLLSKSVPASSVSQVQRSGDKISFVDSALKKQQRYSMENSDRRAPMSSFASAVAHVRQHSGEEKLKVPKSDPHVRQHSSDSSQTEGSFKPRLGQGQAPPGANSMQPPSTNLTAYHNYPHQPEYHHNVKPSDYQPTPTFPSISSSRQNSAFTEVSPRTSRQGSTSSPPQSAPIAYNLDNQNFDQFRQRTNSTGHGHNNLISQENAHSRQASLEIEEYDLDQNFPDVLQRDASSSGGGGKRSGMPLEYHLESGGVAPTQSEAEYMQLMRLVKMQQERIKMQEAQIKDADLEISTLEEQEASNIAKLDVITVEASQLEKEEAKGKIEIEDLEKVEWVNVVDGERKREADIKLQMKNLKEKLVVVESELTQLKEEEEKKSKELLAEKSKIETEQQRSEELQRKTDSEIAQLKEKLTKINKQVEEKEKKLKDIEGMILKADGDIKKQEEEVQKIEEELKDENMKDFQAHPVPKEPPPTSVANLSAPLPVVSTFSTPDSGEAILKILEGRLSPRPSPTAAPGDKKSITSVQQTYKSAMAAKNPNGVWV